MHNCRAVWNVTNRMIDTIHIAWTEALMATLHQCKVLLFDFGVLAIS